MQRLLEIVSLQSEKEIIFNAVKNDIEYMAKHHHGNYVLVQLFNLFEGEKIEFIVACLISSFYEFTLD